MSAVAGGRSCGYIKPTPHRSFGTTLQVAIYQSKPVNPWVGEIVDVGETLFHDNFKRFHNLMKVTEVTASTQTDNLRWRLKHRVENCAVVHRKAHSKMIT